MRYTKIVDWGATSLLFLLMQPIIVVIIIVADIAIGASCSVAHHQRFDRLQFRGKTSNVRTKLVILVRRIIARTVIEGGRSLLMTIRRLLHIRVTRIQTIAP